MTAVTDTLDYSIHVNSIEMSMYDRLQVVTCRIVEFNMERSQKTVQDLSRDYFKLGRI